MDLYQIQNKGNAFLETELAFSDFLVNFVAIAVTQYKGDSGIVINTFVFYGYKNNFRYRFI